MKNQKASALVFSLIMLSLMLAASLSVALVAVRDKRSSLATNKSTQAFQVADSGVEITLKQIYKGTGTYLDELGGGLTCNDNGNALATVSGNIGSAEKSFTINFYDSDGNLMTDCDAGEIADINQLKSTGTFSGASRAVQMAVAQRCSSSSWTKTEVYNSATVFNESPSIALDPSDGFARIIFAGNFLSCANADCSSSTLESAGGDAIFSAKAFDSSGNARIAFTSGNSLRLSQCNDSICSSPTGVIVPGTNNADGVPSLSIGSDGRSRVAYYDSLNHVIKFVLCNASNDCSSPTINTVGSDETQSRFSMALNSSDEPRLSYIQRDASQPLKYVRCNSDCSSAWRTSIDNTFNNITDNSTSIVIGSDDFARISFFDGGNGTSFVRCGDISCSAANRVVNEIDPDTRGYSSLVLDSSDNARIVYSDDSGNPFNSSLIMAQCLNNDCSSKQICQVATTPTFSGRVPSIALDSSDNAHITYYGDIGDVYYAHQ